MADTRHDIDTLNALLSTVVDSVDGFEQAGKGVEDARISAAFADVVSQRRAIMRDIEAEIRNHGGTPEEEGTILGAAHRVLIKIRDAVSSGDTAVVDEAERGEDYIKTKFETATADENLTPAVRSFVAALSSRVTAGHDRISDLKHALHAAH